MMLYPPVKELVDRVGSRYLLVNMIAHRARELSVESEETGVPLEEKPVSTAIGEIYTGKIRPGSEL